MTKNIFTSTELKELSKNSSLNITDLSTFIENKTDKKFSIVQSKMIEELNQRLLDNILFITKLNDYLYNNWSEIIKANKDVTYKWREELKQFKSV